MPPLRRPRAVLFDLDDTLTVRRAAIERFATRFIEDFAWRLALLDRDTLIAAIESADDNGYRARPAFVMLLSQSLPWTRAASDEALLAYWQTVFLSAVSRATELARRWSGCVRAASPWV